MLRAARLPACVCVLLWVGVVACAPSLPAAYVQSKAEAHRAYSAGRYEEAATLFREAASKADRGKERDEVLFLEAVAYERVGRFREAQALLDALLALSPDGRRAAHAAHGSARLEISHGEERKGWAMVHAAILRYPSSGLSRTAFVRYLVHLDEEYGAERAITYLDRGASWFDAHTLGEVAMYERAVRLEKLGRLQDAHDGFVACAQAYPYPKGALFDDALYRSSLIDEALGRGREAVEHLKEMMRFRETSRTFGSYERPKFPAAQMRIAVLYRDALGDPDSARREFRRLFDSFKTSILRDDALWFEALVARQQGDQRGACDAVALLVKALPDSRYVPCAKVVCEDVEVPARSKECRAYIMRDLGLPEPSSSEEGSTAG